jgi:hypothetical protein
MYYPSRIVLPSNILKHIPLYIKQTWVHYQAFVLPDFLQGLTSMTTNLNNQQTQGCDIPPYLNLSIVKAHLQNIESRIRGLFPSLHQMSLEEIHLQHKLMLAKAVVKDFQHRLEEFSSVVDCSFTL